MTTLAEPFRQPHFCRYSSVVFTYGPANQGSCMEVKKKLMYFILCLCIYQYYDRNPPTLLNVLFFYIHGVQLFDLVFCKKKLSRVTLASVCRNYCTYILFRRCPLMGKTKKEIKIRKQEIEICLIDRSGIQRNNGKQKKK